MSTKKVIRAWKDRRYRSKLTGPERAMLPQSPAGSTELTDSELEEVGGGAFGCSWLYCPDTSRTAGGDCYTSTRISCPTYSRLVGDPCTSATICPPIAA